MGQPSADGGSILESGSHLARLWICQDNIGSIYQSLDEIVDLLQGDSHLHLTIVRSVDWAASIDNKETFPRPVDAAQHSRILGDLYSRFGGHLQVVETVRDKICYAARMNALTIRLNGRIVKCVGCLDDPQNDVGMIREDGTLDLHQDKLEFWSRGYRNINYDLLTCSQFKCPSNSTVRT